MDVSYGDLKLAEKHAKEYGAVTHDAPYCDPESPRWFLCFDDFNKALIYLTAMTDIAYEAD
jgi:hypothetical protein